jgi:hypothetical protein
VKGVKDIWENMLVITAATIHMLATE